MTAKKSITITVSILLILLLACLTGRELSARKNTGTNHALIIGISNYSNWSKLESPAKDAEAIAKALAKQYNFRKSNIKLLTDNTKEKPTLINILTSLDNHAAKLTENDNLLIFFTGHSLEDDEGETYWIPIDGREKSKRSWLKHSDIVEEMFATEKFKAKNLCIITDSAFSDKLIRKYENPVTIDDLRYREKILDRASRKSREVIAFGDQHWPGGKSTDGMGLFAYHIHRLLLDNDFEMIDFENLIFLFDDSVPFSIRKVAGTKLVTGRIKTPEAEKGQFVISRLAPSPVVDVLATTVSPDKGYPGDQFTVAAKTSSPAAEVYIKIGSKKHIMQGSDTSGTEWQYSMNVDKLGSTPFIVAAINPNDIEGKPKEGRITTIKALSAPANVKAVTVSPTKGLGGDPFNFTATTDNPAAKVALLVKGERYKMSGSGTQWSLTQKVDHVGSVDFSVVATNTDGVEGDAKGGNLQLEAGISHVVAVKSKPETGFAGEEFMISVKTDRIAKSVALEMDGKVYPMEGSGSSWQFKKVIPDIGTKQFTVLAKNIKGQTGRSLSGQLTAKKSPLAIPEIASVDVGVVSPGKGYVGDSFAIKVNTTAPSDTVFVEVEGKEYTMQGSGTKWNYVARLDNLGVSRYSVTARNKDGVKGKPKAGEIKTIPKPAKPVNVITAQVNPQKGELQQKFAFTAKTDRPAKSVSLVVGTKRYNMSGSGTDWRLNRNFDQAGTMDFKVVARNENNVEGGFQTAAFTVVEKRYQLNKDGTITDQFTQKTRNRFVDNKDGTVTDLLTSLMWLKTPKQIALTYQEATDYCRDLEEGGHKGWRLPTINELSRISDDRQQNPALPLNHPFTSVVTHMLYWSKTKHLSPKNVKALDMYRGKIRYQKKAEISIVWPVRYAES